MRSVRMTGFHSTASLDEALDALLPRVKLLGEEKVALEDALGRVLASDVAPKRDIPPFDRAAMDGYALRGEETSGASPEKPVAFKVIGEITAGDSKGMVVKKGEAVKIATGGMVPKGADAVVMLEYTRQMRGDRVEVMRPVPPGKNVSPKGEDAKKGEVLLRAGARLRPQDIAILAAMGEKEVRVRRRPRIGIVSTGDELAEPGSELEHGEIYDANSYSLSALVKMNGGVPERLGIVRDDVAKLRRALEKISEYDALVLSGATSVGGKDFVPKVIEELGEISVHGIAMRPGRPTGFGVIDDKIVFMLPGSPVAAMFAFEAIVRPAMQKMLGAQLKSPYFKIRATLAGKVASELGRRDYVRVRFVDENSVEPISTSGSGVITTTVKADGFIVVPEDVELLAEGEEVEVYLYSFHL